MPSSSSSESSAVSSPSSACPSCPAHASIPDERPLRLPPGFSFRPRDQDMVSLLCSKVSGLASGRLVRGTPLSDVDVSLFEPEELPRNKRDRRQDVSYFFTTRTKEGPDGGLPIRATPKGCWKATTGKDREVREWYDVHVVGFKKMFVYYKGKAPDEVKTFWMMKEVRMNPHLEQHKNCDPHKMERWVMCKVYSYVEEEGWEDDETSEEDDETSEEEE